MKLEIKIKDHLQFNKAPPDKVIKKFLAISSEELTGQIKKETPVDKEKLRNSWTPKLSNNKLTITNSRNYAVFVEKGTGIFGQRRHRIFPTNAKVLHFNTEDGEVFTTNTRGQPGRHMAEKGLEKYTYRIPTIFHNAVSQTLKSGG